MADAAAHDENAARHVLEDVTGAPLPAPTRNDGASIALKVNVPTPSMLSPVEPGGSRLAESPAPIRAAAPDRRATVAMAPSRVAPHIPPGLFARYAILQWVRHLSREPLLLSRLKDRFLDGPLALESERQLQGATPPSYSLPEYQREEMDAQRFAALLTSAKQPFVIRGLGRDSEAVQRWCPEFFRERLGDLRVPIRILGEDGFTTGERMVEGSFGEFLDDIIAGRPARRYIDNCADVLESCPEIAAQLPWPLLTTLMGRRKHVVSHAFIGGPQTKTHIHCANGFNLFLMIHGRKTWTFFHPEHSAWLYPRMNEDALYCYTLVNFEQREEQEYRFPLFKYLPRYRVQLEPGDALLNLPWWWHAVHNDTPATIAVATRWLAPIFRGNPNPLFSAMQLFTPHTWRLLANMLRGKKLNDAGVRRRFHRVAKVKNNVR